MSVYPFILVPKEDICKVSLLLKKRLPRSCHVYNMVLKQANFADRMEVYTLQEDLGEDAWIILRSHREDMGQDINVSVPLEPRITTEIKEAFVTSDFIDWEKPYLFPALDRSISRMILDISAFVKGNCTRIFPCHLYYMELTDASKYQPEKPINGKVQKLDDQGPEFMMKQWKHARQGTRDYLEVLIARNNTMGIYVDNELVSGAITHLNGTIGMLNTCQEHRRKGYAQICMKSLMKELADEGLVPCSSAEIPNDASRALHEKLGMRFSHVVDYIGSFGKLD